MQSVDFTLKNIAYFLICAIGTGWILFIGDFIIVPMLYGLFFAILLRPLVNRYQKMLKRRVPSLVLAFLTILISFIVIAGLISYQLFEIINSLPAIGENVETGIYKVIEEFNNMLPSVITLQPEELVSQFGSLLSTPLSLLGKGVVLSSNSIVEVLIAFIYGFFILLYSKSIKNFVIYQYKRTHRKDVKQVLFKIQETIQQFVSGMLTVIILLSVINSLCLYLIGIKYAVFWGVLGGLLAIIPYVGTVLGGLLPLLYAISTTGTYWQPLAIIAAYSLIQQLEGNFITPKVIGDKVNVNPLVAILSLILFGSLWGVGGVILALPLISIVRIIISEFEATQPISLLMRADIRSLKDKFKELAHQ